MNVLIVDRSREMGELTATALREDPDVNVVGMILDIREALKRATECDVILVSAGLPADHAMDLVRAARRQWPQLRVVVMDLDVDELATRYYYAGAHALVYHGDSLDDLLARARQPRIGFVAVHEAVAA